MEAKCVDFLLYICRPSQGCGSSGVLIDASKYIYPSERSREEPANHFQNSSARKSTEDPVTSSKWAMRISIFRSVDAACHVPHIDSSTDPGTAMSCSCCYAKRAVPDHLPLRYSEPALCN